MATEKISKVLYGGDVKINFFPGAHRYKLAGSKEWLTGVTSVTGLIDKSRVLLNWAMGLAQAHLEGYLSYCGEMVRKDELAQVLKDALRQHEERKEEAASFGHQVHAFADQYAQSKISGTPMPTIGEGIPDQVLGGINSFLDFVKAHNVRFIETERMVYSKEYGFVGTADAIIEVDGVRHLVDWKSGKGVYSEAFIQISAYIQAYAEETGKRLPGMIVHFDKESGAFTSFPVSTEEVSRDFRAFSGLLEAKNRLKERNRV